MNAKEKNEQTASNILNKFKIDFALTDEDMAEYFGVSRRTIIRWKGSVTETPKSVINLINLNYFNK